MPNTTTGRPETGEYLPYYAQYIALVPDGDIVALLDRRIAATEAFCATLSATQARQRRGPAEWNTTEIIGHLADVERIFTYRALRIARADETPLNGVDLDPYVTMANAAARPLADMVAEFATVRRATVSLFRSFDAVAWQRLGTADGNAIGVRALAYIIAGHEIHHLADLRAWFDGEGRR